MNRDGSGGIVDRNGEFEQFHQQGRGNARDDANGQRLNRSNQRGARAGGDQACKPSVGAQAGVGLAETDAGHGECSRERAGGGEQRAQRGCGQRGKRSMQPEDCSGHVPCEPANQGDKAAEEHINGVVTGQRGRKAFLGELALARTCDPDNGEGAESAQDMDCGRSAGIEKARAEREVDAELRQPTAVPDPVREQRKDDGGSHGSGSAAGGEAPAIRS